MFRTIKNEKHEFALFYQEIPDKTGLITILDHELIHRLIHVLRLTTGDSFILFNRLAHARVQVISLQKKSIELLVDSIEQNKPLKPDIIFGLPLLKRDAFEQALYAATELGATEIQLLITEKSQRAWAEKDILRAENIIHAAAEQSKNFSFPLLKKPILLSYLSGDVANRLHIFFDPAGKSVDDVIKQAQSYIYSSYLLLVGPEGDLTGQEKEFLKKQGFVFACLTPTILRAYQAATVCLGIFRSFLS